MIQGPREPFDPPEPPEPPKPPPTRIINEDVDSSVLRNTWRIWAKALGPKEGCTNYEANMVAIIRTGFVVLTIIAEICIIYNTLTN